MTAVVSNLKQDLVTTRFHFSKMHGAGNDFVVIDLRTYAAPDAELCAILADRHKGVGCDLILGVGQPTTEGAVAPYHIWTARGEPSMQCGNGARCVAAWVVRAGLTQADQFVLDSPSGPVAIRCLMGGLVRVSLKPPSFSLDNLLTKQTDGVAWDINVETDGGELYHCFPVSTGNPHAVIEVINVDNAPVGEAGPALQNGSRFPRTVNVGFAEIVSRKRIRLRVYEFGAGETLACGTGACAAAAVFMRQGRVDRTVTVSLPGGDLSISWPDDTQNILIDGPAQFTFEGEFNNGPV